MSWLSNLAEARRRADTQKEDPWREKVERFVRGQEMISTAALLDLLGVPKTTGNARRLAKIMHTLGFVPIKSRRLLPGGYRDTVARGWARPVIQLPMREEKNERS
jgi:hypothetical protein